MPYTLLLADDSVTIQRVIELTFADEDVQVVAVSDGEQAIAILDQRPPDIVLADIGMPNRNGYDVAHHIRTRPTLAHIPIVLLAGAFEPVDDARANQLGVDAVLAKPFEPQLVITKVKELLARPRREPVEPPLVLAAVAPAADDYFDRLDQAFATLADQTPQPTADPPPPMQEPREPAYVASDEPMLGSAGTPTYEPGGDVQTPLPSLSDAFAALLDAEQDASSAGARPVWPSARGGAVIVPDALVERVTHDVLERLSDRAVKEAVADIVSSVAERLVRDEIDRIKASIRS